jgi:hypothetical protein
MAIDKQTVIDILRSTETQTINFSFTGSTGMKITIQPAHFARVADAIAEDRISVVYRGGGIARGMAKYSSKAEGTDAANTFYIGRNSASSNDFKGLMVHEAVHAIFDLWSSRVPWLDNEAAAYIAQGYFLRNVGYARSRMNQLGQPYLGLMVIDTVLSGDDISYWLGELRNSLNSDQLYHSYIRTDFQGDG